MALCLLVIALALCPSPGVSVGQGSAAARIYRIVVGRGARAAARRLELGELRRLSGAGYEVRAGARSGRYPLLEDAASRMDRSILWKFSDDVASELRRQRYGVDDVVFSRDVRADAAHIRRASVSVVPVSQIAEARGAAGEGLVIAQRSEVPHLSPAKLHEKLTELRLYSALPRGRKEAERVFGSAVAQEYLPEQWARWYRRSRRVTGSGVSLAPRPPVGMSRADHLQALADEAGTGERILLIGHLDEGALRLPDGSAIPLGELPRNVVAIGCNSLKAFEEAGLGVGLGTTRDIQLVPALKLQSESLRLYEPGIEVHQWLRRIQDLEGPLVGAISLAPLAVVLEQVE